MKPRLGPEWSTLCDVTAKLADGRQLDDDDRAWLCRLLVDLGDGLDVRSQFFAPGDGREDESARHVWMAIDLERLRREGHPDPEAEVGQRWHMAAPSVTRTLSRKKIDGRQLPAFPREWIDYMRTRLAAERKRRTKPR